MFVFVAWTVPAALLLPGLACPGAGNEENYRPPEWRVCRQPRHSGIAGMRRLSQGYPVWIVPFMTTQWPGKLQKNS